MFAFLDSGIGGLEVLSRAVAYSGVRNDVLYVADSELAGYGSLSKRELVDRLLFLEHSLAAAGCSHLVLACNTASTVIPQLQRRSRLPIYGPIEPTAGAIRDSGKSKAVLIATPRTIQSEVYSQCIQRFAPATFLRSLALNEFATLLEFGSADQASLAEYLEIRLRKPMRGADCVILGCTHYCSSEVEKVLTALWPNVSIVNSADELARGVAPVMDAANTEIAKHPRVILTATGSTTRLKRRAAELFRAGSYEVCGFRDFGQEVENCS